MDKTGKSKSGHLFVISAPSGSGKSTLVTRALARLNKKTAHALRDAANAAPQDERYRELSAHPEEACKAVSKDVLERIPKIARIVTYTTRPPRVGEINGQDYVFVTKDEFVRLQAENHFLEVTTYYDILYGSPCAFLDRLPQGESFIAITDRSGLAFYKKLYDAAVCIWISPPSMAVLEQRLSARGSESPESLRRRLDLAAQEMAQEKSSPLCQYHIVNDDLTTATQELVKIISDRIR